MVVTVAYRRFLQLILLLACSIHVSLAASPSLNAYVSSNQVGVGETFQLNLELANVQANQEPDFSALESDFSILNNHTAHETRNINGSYSSTIRWQLVLAARKTGSLTIPAFEISGQKSQPIQIQVTTGSATSQIIDQKVKIELNTDKDTAYPNEQIKLQLRLFRALDAESEDLTDLIADNAELVQQGKPQQYFTTIKGIRYKVYQLNYLAFASGTEDIVIHPITYKGIFRIGRYQQQVKEFSTAQKIIKVAPIPKVINGWWLPASNLRVSTSIEPSQKEYMVGDTLTQTIILQADGLKSEQLPQLKLPQIKGLNYYQETPKFENNLTEQGISSSRIDNTAIVATQPGDYTLPAIQIKWWNTQSKKIEIINIPERTFHVKANPATALQQQHFQVEAPAANNPQQTASQSNTAVNIVQSTIWDQYSLTFIVLLGLSLTANIIIWYSCRRYYLNQANNQKKTQADSKKSNANGAHYIAQLKAACEQRQAGACYHTLKQWARQQGYPELGQLLVFSPALEKQVKQLETLLYGASADEKAADIDFNSILQHVKKLEKLQRQATPSTLEQLYP